MKNKNLDKALRKSNKKKEDKVVAIAGELGIPLNGQKLIAVPNRQGFVFVRLKNNTSELIQAYNSTVPEVYDLPVLVVRRVGVYTVIGRNFDRYTNQWGQAAYLPKHGTQHSFNPSLNIGGDTTWVYSQQFMPLLGYPSGSLGSPRVAISPYLIRDLNGNWKYAGNTGTPDVSVYNPTTGSRATMALIYIDTVSGNPGIIVNSGTYVDASLTGTNQVAPYIPQVSNPNWIPSVAIRLVSGTSSLTWSNLYDVRPFLQVIPTGTSGGGGGGGGGSFGFVAWDEGIFLGTGTVLNFVGAGVTATISGTVVDVNIPGGGGSGGSGTVVIMDDGVTRGSASNLNFGSQLSAVITGSTAFIDVSSTVITDDLTTYVNGTGTSFLLTSTPLASSLRLYYNGVRQRFNVHYNISGSYLQTLFTPATGSTLITDYSELASGGGSGDGDNMFALGVAIAL